MAEVRLLEPIEDGDRLWISAYVVLVQADVELLSALYRFRTKGGEWSLSALYASREARVIPSSVRVAAAQVAADRLREAAERANADADRFESWLARQEPTP